MQLQAFGEKDSIMRFFNSFPGGNKNTNGIGQFRSKDYYSTITALLLYYQGP
jgi:hypothetical protein